MLASQTRVPTPSLCGAGARTQASVHAELGKRPPCLPVFVNGFIAHPVGQAHRFGFALPPPQLARLLSSVPSLDHRGRLKLISQALCLPPTLIPLE